MRFAITAIGSALLYGLMVWSSYGIWWAIDPTINLQTPHLLLEVLIGQYGWLPSFLGGLLTRGRAVLLGVVTVVGGSVAKLLFHDLFTPTIFADNWSPPLVNLANGVLALVVAAIAAMAGQCLANHRTSNKTIHATCGDARA